MQLVRRQQRKTGSTNWSAYDTNKFRQVPSQHQCFSRRLCWSPDCNALEWNCRAGQNTLIIRSLRIISSIRNSSAR